MSNIFCNFAVVLNVRHIMASCRHSILSLEDILSLFFAKDQHSAEASSLSSPLLKVMKDLYAQHPSSPVCAFNLEIVLRIPAQLPDGFNLYKYMS